MCRYPFNMNVNDDVNNNVLAEQYPIPRQLSPLKNCWYWKSRLDGRFRLNSDHDGIWMPGLFHMKKVTSLWFNKNRQGDQRWKGIAKVTRLFLHILDLRNLWMSPKNKSLWHWFLFRYGSITRSIHKWYPNLVGRGPWNSDITTKGH